MAIVVAHRLPFGDDAFDPLYRIEQPTDVLELGLDEALDHGVSLIEWPERMGPLIPAERLDVMLTQGPKQESRHVSLMAHGVWTSRLSDIADD